MTIAERVGEDKGGKPGFLRQFLGDWVLVAIVVLSSTLSFGLGWLAAREAGAGKDGVWIEQMPLKEAEGGEEEVQAEEDMPSRLPAQPAAAVSAMEQGGGYVASKTGTKYYLPWCGTAKRIKEENRVWFQSKEAAEAAGYEPASNCKGL